jgi:hypothetical protein
MGFKAGFLAAGIRPFFGGAVKYNFWGVKVTDAFGGI